jgi:poly-beta-1,6-N-acetyl-D-glucosamine N-deacetylase PgaB
MKKQLLIIAMKLSLISASILPAYALDTLPIIKDHPIDKLSPKNVSAISSDSNQFKSINMKIMHVDIDYVFDANKTQQEKNIDLLIQRIKTIQPNTIFLQAFADPDANGSTDAVYFENRYIPVRDNIFPELLRKIRQETQVQKVFAWMPLIAWEFPEKYKLQYVQHTSGQNHGYIRLSPFDDKNIQYVSDIFKDFMQNNSVDGILYHDDITLSDYEDYSEVAQQTYKKWGFNVDAVFKERKDHFQLAQFKTAYLDQFAAGITKIIKADHPDLLTARNMYANVTLDPKSETWMSQSMTSTYNHYDFNAIMAMPYMENASDHQQFYLDLIKESKKYDPNLERTIFELQAVDWKTNKKIPTSEIVSTIELLEKNGVKHIGYYPDDFVASHPEADKIKQVWK